jgi:tetratricopeptide (TPR) repeat protein
LASTPGSYEFLVGDCWTLLAEDGKAEAAYQRAMELRPESSNGWVGLCHLRLLQGNVEAARKLITENGTQSFGGADAVNDNHPAEIRAQVEFFKRNYSEAEKLYGQLVKNNPGGGVFSYGALSYASCLGRIRQALGKQAEAKSTLEAALTTESAIPSRSNDPATIYRIAAIEGSLGRIETALDELHAAAAAGWLDYRSLQLDPRFDSIKGDPRFRDTLSALKSKVSELRRENINPRG